MKKFNAARFFVTTLSLLVLSNMVLGQEIPPRALIDTASAAACKRWIPSSEQVTVALPSEPGATGMVVTIKPGKDPFPGVKLKPDSGEIWNLVSYGHIEAVLTNLGIKTLRLNLRVDNATGFGNSPWDTEYLKVDPGKTEKVSLIFGYGSGHMPAYPVKADAVSAILLFMGKVSEECTFRIDSLVAGGPPDEKPLLPDDLIQTKPKDGVIFGANVKINSSKQLECLAGAMAEAQENTLLLTFPQAKGVQLVKLKPEIGKWDLRQASRIRVVLKNEGTAAVMPIVFASTDAATHTDKIISSTPLAPGDQTQIIVPFSAINPWKGGLSSDKPGNVPALPGTGTSFISGRTASISFSATSEAPAQLRVISVVADTVAADLPEWLGKRPPVPGDWSLTFEDNFNGNTIDANKWNIKGPNYWDKGSHWSKDNLIIGNGVVKMRFEKKTGFHNDDPTQKSTDYASGYLDTQDKFRQCYGYFESRMKLPAACGLWPAFWTMPDRGLAAGRGRGRTSDGGMEFDIMEFLAVWGPHRYNIAMHWDNYGPDHKSTGAKPYFETDKDGFITSGMLWLPGLAVFYCNGKEIGRWEDPRVCNVPSYIMYTLPAGGWDNNFLDEKALPDDFVIDYVRVWQRSDLKLAEEAQH